ncbi:MTOR-associated protein MEAK7-like [Saccoglossus kowalevskii]|uniref:MTOR-associated protein MEAK7 n=1 Tax=Saccoglossus kowalevskii TaxID=10224 RepID=A0ABM0H0R6_SACKO|nr:PREDICTED: TLD domain-containing protein 1-like [Saccoglossus kowalevskii]
MGGQGSKVEECSSKYEAVFNAAEKAELGRVFNVICSGDGHTNVKTAFGLKCLQDYIGDRLSDKIITRLHAEMCNMLSSSSEKHSIVTMEMFTITMAFLLKGTIEEQSCIIHHLATENNDSVSSQDMYEFVSDIIHYVEDALQPIIEAKHWQLKTTPESNDRFARYLVKDLFWKDVSVTTDLPDKSYSPDDIQIWLESKPHFAEVFTEVFRYAFKFQMAKSVVTASTDAYQSVDIFPLCQDVKFIWNKLQTLLDIPSMLMLNQHLPGKLKTEWRLLFSTRLHGESFATFLQHITLKGPTIILVKDHDGHMFGGFASEEWKTQAQFYGNATSFLFSLYPTMEVYESSGRNGHYMYINLNQQTLPNGLGMGGQLNYFGLWIDANFGKGSSKAKPRCTTYDSPQLSKQENFQVDVVEVWHVGPIQVISEDEDKPSILDADPEAAAILELIGKERKSEGLREKDPS